MEGCGERIELARRTAPGLFSFDYVLPGEGDGHDDGPTMDIFLLETNDTHMYVIGELQDIKLKFTFKNCKRRKWPPDRKEPLNFSLIWWEGETPRLLSVWAGETGDVM